MLKKINKPKVFFWLILFLAIFLRLYKLGEIPKYLNRDEASLGYNAYSILQTGREEHGILFPVNIESFGDWKLPVYVYSSTIFIYLFGLSALAIRLPAALAGIGIVIVSYFLSNRIIKNQEKENISLLVMLFTAVTPWAIHLSRIAYEANFAMFLFLLGFLSFLKAKEKPFFYIITAVTFVLAVFTYHAYQVFIPLFSLYLFISNFSVLRQSFLKNKKIIVNCFLIVTLGMFLLLFSGTKNANTTKFSGLSILDLKSYTTQVDNERSFIPNRMIQKLYANKATAFFQKVVSNIFTLYSFDFLIARGGSNTGHNIAGSGNLYLILLIFVIFALIKHSKNQNLKLVIIWLLLASVAPLITFESNHTVRFSPSLVAWQVLAAVGCYYLWITYKKSKVIQILIVFVISYSVFHYLTNYFIAAPSRDSSRFDWYMKDMVLFVSREKNDYDKVYIPEPGTSPYIFYLFYTQYKPAFLSSNLEFYNPDQEGFRHAKRLDNIYFEKIDWDKNELLNQNFLYVIRDTQVSADKKSNPLYKMVGSLSDPQSEIKYEFWEFKGKR